MAHPTVAAGRVWSNLTLRRGSTALERAYQANVLTLPRPSPGAGFLHCRISTSLRRVDSGGRGPPNFRTTPWGCRRKTLISSGPPKRFNIECDSWLILGLCPASPPPSPSPSPGNRHAAFAFRRRAVQTVAMSRGAFTIRTWPERAVNVRCDKCGREGRYARAALSARFGPDKAMPDVLEAVTGDCAHAGSGIMARCRRAVYIDPQTGEPWSRRNG